MSGDNILMPPKEAAERLEVSPSGLRRLASLYEGIYGPLPRDSSDGRMWPEEAVKRLIAARAVVGQGRAKSIQDALTASSTGDRPPSSALTQGVPMRPLEGEALQLLLEEVKAVRREVAELRTENNAIRRQLEEKPLDPQTLAVDLELAKMNRYLLGELERRRLEIETKRKRRVWWRFWSY